MYKQLIYSILVFSMLTFGCKKTENGHDVSYIQDFEIPAGNSFYFQKEFVSNSDRDVWLAKYNINKDAVKSVLVKFARLSILYTNDRFDWVDKGYLQIAKYDTNPTPNFFEISFNLQVPTDQGSYLDLAPDLTELKDYFLSDKFKLRLKLVNRSGQTTSSAVQVRLSLGLSVITE